MNRITYLQELIPDSYGTVPALVSALTPQEACTLLRSKFIPNAHLRRYVAKKIAKDISRLYQPCHQEVVSWLIDVVQHKKIPRTESYAYLLHVIAQDAPTEIKDSVLDIFLTSRYVSLRNRGYKLISESWDTKYIEILEKNWTLHNDVQCAGLIVKHFSEEFIHKHYLELVPVLESWQVAQIFLKLGAKDAAIVAELKNIDPVSYVYVTVKLGRQISESEAKKLLKDNFMDERIGLLLWCFGQLGYWDTIVEFKQKYVPKIYAVQRAQILD